MAPASIACSLMGIDIGSISNTGKNPLRRLSPICRFFLQRENYNVHEMVTFSGTQAGIDTLLSILITRSAYIGKWSVV
jgi:hypothetical protein